MAYQSVFKRYELKYLLTEAQKGMILDTMALYMSPDKYGRTTIRNLYFDTDSYLLIRRSIQKPVFKEKLRIRSYGQAASDSAVFVELKRKYASEIYKRRISLPEETAMAWVSGQQPCPESSQISREIDYFLGHYETLRPAVFLSYEREAFYANDGSGFRVTFDDNILCRQQELSLRLQVYGTPILPDGKVLMEIKCSGGIPLWMTRLLSAQHIYKTSFSKYGTAYETLIFPQLHSEILPIKET